jgi:hypothetical protein
MRSTSMWMFLVLCIIGAVMATGCKTQDPYNLNLCLSPSLSNQAGHVEVHLIPVTYDDFNYWKDMNVADYWQAGNSPRADLVHSGSVRVVKFSGSVKPVVLDSDDDAWRAWFRDQKYYAVIALCNVPSDASSAPGEGDRRRKILWVRRSNNAPKKVQLEVTATGFMRITTDR